MRVQLYSIKYEHDENSHGNSSRSKNPLAVIDGITTSLRRQECEFHADQSHETKNCVILHLKVKRLIKNEEFARFLGGRRQPKPRGDQKPLENMGRRGGKQRERWGGDEQHQRPRNQKTIVEIQTIAGGFVGGEFVSANKAYAHQMQALDEVMTLVRASKSWRKESLVLAFFAED